MIENRSRRKFLATATAVAAGTAVAPIAELYAQCDPPDATIQQAVDWLLAKRRPGIFTLQAFIDNRVQAGPKGWRRVLRAQVLKWNSRTSTGNAANEFQDGHEAESATWLVPDIEIAEIAAQIRELAGKKIWVYKEA
jgi:hypothetical protein